nr:MAG TPA: hypothetical protein [Caudoviricetes sp.]
MICVIYHFLHSCKVSSKCCKIIYFCNKKARL